MHARHLKKQPLLLHVYYCKLIILWGPGILFHLSIYFISLLYSNFKRQVTDNCGLALAVKLGA